MEYRNTKILYMIRPDFGSTRKQNINMTFEIHQSLSLRTYVMVILGRKHIGTHKSVA